MSLIRQLIELLTERDTVIDVLITERGCRQYLPGMSEPDMAIIHREGQRRWAEVLTAQRRLYRPNNSADGRTGNLLRMR